MFDHRASIRYAKPLIELSISKGVLEEVNKDVKLFLEICNKNFDFSLLLKNPIIPSGKKVGIIRSIFSKIIHPLTLNALIKIIYNNRDKILENICVKFGELYNDYKFTQEATLISAISLNQSTIEKIKFIASRITSKKILLNQRIDPNIIGGFRLQIGDKMYDASYNTKLKNIKKILLNN